MRLSIYMVDIQVFIVISKVNSTASVSCPAVHLQRWGDSSMFNMWYFDPACSFRGRDRRKQIQNKYLWEFIILYFTNSALLSSTISNCMTPYRSIL